MSGFRVVIIVVRVFELLRVIDCLCTFVLDWGISSIVFDLQSLLATLSIVVVLAVSLVCHNLAVLIHTLHKRFCLRVV